MLAVSSTTAGILAGELDVSEWTDEELIRIHDLRHTCAALLISQGVHPKRIQAHLGHASITTTLDRYGHLFPDDMDQLADGLEATYQAARGADWMRTGSGSGVPKLSERRGEKRV
jgi:integrase-like protein